jgi:hypothetical protein
MTWKHAFIICFALAVVAACGMSANCGPMMTKLGDLAMVAISAAAGNAMADQAKSKKPEHPPT